jgi:hypothetical protein
MRPWFPPFRKERGRVGHPQLRSVGNSRFLTRPSARFGMTRINLRWLYAALKRRSSTLLPRMELGLRPWTAEGGCPHIFRGGYFFAVSSATAFLK